MGSIIAVGVTLQSLKSYESKEDFISSLRSVTECRWALVANDSLVSLTA